MEITIKMNANEMLNAAERGLLEGLAKCDKKEQPDSITEPVQLEMAPSQIPMSAPTQKPRDATEYIVTQPAVPVEAPAAPVRDVTTAVPTQQVTYTQEDLALAATQLVDAGKIEQIQELLAKFGVPALTHLAKEQYGAFAAELRNMGAKI